MAKLAIDGGNKIFDAPIKHIYWPPVYEDTAEQIKELYLSRQWSFYGPLEQEFNVKFSEYTGAGHCVMMANGTVTLEMALKAYGIGPGDEVIVPAESWIATGEVVSYRGATPVIVDIERDTLCLDPVKFEEAITPRTKAVIPVHLFGSMADMDKIVEIARRHNIRVIEDCAHAHGGMWRGKHVGTLGDVGSFSFQQTKLLASGEGGACITNDDETAELLSRLSHIGTRYAAKQGEVCAPPPEGLICHNYRLTDFQALILLSQLRHLKEDTMLRAENAEFLRERLNQIPGIRMQAAGRGATLQSYYFLCTMVDHKHLKPGITRKEVMAALTAEGIYTFPAWEFPMYRQNLWTVPADQYRIASSDVAEEVVNKELMTCRCVWLMQDRKTLSLVVDAFSKVMEHYYC